MASKYLERLSHAVGQATARSHAKAELTCKHFFSGAALYADGRIGVSFTPVGLAFKLSERRRAALLKARHARLLRYFANGPVKKEYVVLNPAIMDDPREFRRWLTASIRYVTRRRSTKTDGAT